MNFFKHISFLKEVLRHSITAFGGPQVAVSLMQHRFVEKRKDLTTEELLEYNGFCQLLPGASSTQTIVLVGYKIGGFPLAVLTLLVWAAPAILLMTLFALLYSQFAFGDVLQSFKLLQPMTIGFIASATLFMYRKAINNHITQWIFVITVMLTFVGFKTPWTIPLLIIGSGVATNFSSKRFPDKVTSSISIKWLSLIVFVVLFLFAGFFSEQSSRHHWKHNKIYNLFEMNYRFGSLVFGGGDVLIPMMYEQYVTRPQSTRIIESKRDVVHLSKEDFMTGSGLVRVVPGPIFSISSFMGAAALKENGVHQQIVGAIIAATGIFLPSFLIVLFFFPIWQHLKQYAIIFRSLEGIYASIVGIMLGATLYLSNDIAIDLAQKPIANTLVYLAVGISTFYLLFRQKLAPQWIALSCLLLGYLIKTWM
jgi:chromate transporter